MYSKLIIQIVYIHNLYYTIYIKFKQNINFRCSNEKSEVLFYKK